MKKRTAFRAEQQRHEEICALHCRYSLWGQNFHIWVYELDGLLIETGPIRARSPVQSFVREHLPRSAVLTHHHEDHSGNAAWLAADLGLPVYMGAETASILADPSRIPLYRRMVWGQMEPVRGTVTEVIETDRFRLQSLPTPGHAGDHVAWVEEDRGWAFTGDLYLAPRLLYGLRDESIAAMIRSIRAVLELPVNTIFCSHAGIVTEGRKALEKKLAFLERLQEETIRLSREGVSPRRIADRLLERRWGVVLFSMGEMAPVHLVRSILREAGAER